MSSELILVASVILGGGGVTAALVAFRKLPAEVESISVLAAEKAVAAMERALDQREKDLVQARDELVRATETAADCKAEIETLRTERNGLSARVRELEAERGRLGGRVSHLEQVLHRHGLNGEA